MLAVEHLNGQKPQRSFRLIGLLGDVVAMVEIIEPLREHESEMGDVQASGSIR